MAEVGLQSKDEKAEEAGGTKTMGSRCVIREQEGEYEEKEKRCQLHSAQKKQ